MSDAEVDSILNGLAAAPQPLRTPGMRAVARAAARRLRERSADDVLAIADQLIDHDADGARAAAIELVFRHRAAREALDWRWLERLGRTLDGWASVDHFARQLSGPAWQRGQISDARVRRWATSADFWWRRVGLVSTIALNERHLGRGDAARTLAICELFVDERADLHVKALSWALRELGLRDPEAALQFITEREDRLAPRVVREVRNKLETGHKQGRPSEAMQRRMAKRKR